MKEVKTEKSLSQLYNDDAIKVMTDLIRSGFKVNHIITDPPYNIARDNNFESMGRSSLDFGEWDKDFDQFSYIDLAYELIEKGGSLVIFNDWKNLGDITKYAEKVGFVVKDPIRWVKDNPIPRNRDRRYITDYEMGVWLVKPNAKWVFNRLSDTYDRPEYNYPVVGGKEKTSHPTQKPVALMEEMVLRHTNELDIILDPFMGSGSTGVACKNTNRHFVGIELEQAYFDIAKKRIFSN